MQQFSSANLLSGDSKKNTVLVAKKIDALYEQVCKIVLD